MKKTVTWVACALAFGSAAYAGGDKPYGNEAATSPAMEEPADGSPAEMGTGGSGMVHVDEAKLKEMKMKTRQAMQQHKAWIDKNLQGWPEKTKEVAAVTIAAYGPPEGVTPTMLTWGAKGPWAMTILHREEVEHAFPMPHKDVLQQFVKHDVPADKFDELANYDGSVVAERTTGMLSARCDKEEANFLAINLANDVATGKKSVEEARDYYANAIKGMLAGKMDPYLERIQFKPDAANAGDTDQARFQNPMRQTEAQGRKPSSR